MTPQERENPELMNMSRKQRIANGCGHNIHEVNMFLKQFDQMRRMMHKMSKMPGMGAGAPGGATGAAARRSKRRR